MSGRLRAVPDEPAVYALYGAGRDAAYVGIARTNLRERITQHLVKRDSSVTTGVSVVSLNPELVRRVAWWLHPRFADAVALEAAELIAFEVLDPVMRSRGTVGKAAFVLAEEEATKEEFLALFGRAPSGHLDIPTMAEVLDRLEALEARVAHIEERGGSDA